MLSSETCLLQPHKAFPPKRGSSQLPSNATQVGIHQRFPSYHREFRLCTLKMLSQAFAVIVMVDLSVAFPSRYLTKPLLELQKLQGVASVDPAYWF